ncbi:LsmAD domain-containing protein [Spinellus fusiger]|nr:LsmAD domain-containing protein [Spinellus fusiger]
MTPPSGAPLKRTESYAENSDVAKKMHERMLFLLVHLTGSRVQITVQNGTKFEGIFHGASSEGDLGVSLKMARKIYDPAPPTENEKTNPYPVQKTLLIVAKDLVEITATGVDLTMGEHPKQERDNALESLEEMDTLAGTAKSWDQFAANEKLFGLKTDFDEEIYTTRIDRLAPGYKDREKKAIEMANEIQRSTTTNVHLMEERGHIVQDDGMDEEDRYGAVVRDADPNKYMPPALRKLQQQLPTGKKEVSDKSVSNLPPNSPLHKLTTGSPKAQTPPPTHHLPPIRQESGAATAKKLGDATSNKCIEAEIATTFRQFAMVEKDKLHAKKQALQKKEKDGRLAELVKFHQTFKLNVPVPADLMPLLSKGKKQNGSPDSDETALSSDTTKKSTQRETIATVEPLVEAKPPANKPVEKPTTEPHTTKPHTDTKPAPPPTSSGFKFNVKASEFKPNPSAPSFVPGSARISSAESSPFFAGRQLKKGAATEHLSVSDIFTAPFSKGKHVNPNSVGPIWPFGSKPYRHQLNQFVHYDEEMFTNYPPPNYPYGYPQYRYPQQYMPGMSPIPIQQPGAPYMSPQFVPNGPINGTPNVAYSPQMPNGSPHGSPFPQGYPSPQRSPMMPQGIPPHQVYQYQGNAPHGGPMMMRYPPEMMPPNMTGPGPVIVQRPMMLEPNVMHYPPQHDHLACKFSLSLLCFHVSLYCFI